MRSAFLTRLPGHNFSVAAGPYRIVVIGTKFRLHVEGIKVAVAVDEGVVEVWRKHRLVRLATGDSWTSPFESRWRAGRRPGGRPGRAAGGEPAAGAGRSVAPAPAPVPAVTAPAAPAAAAPRRRSIRCRRRRPRWRPAIRTARSTSIGWRSARGGPAAENAEYEIGRVQRDRLRQPAEAIATWKRYRSSHPNGLLRVETDVSIIEALVGFGRLERRAERGERLPPPATPTASGAAEIARVAGDLYRERGDYTHAVGAYQTALAASRTREATEYASFQRAACLLAMGQASGNVALEEYLHAWPQGRFSREANRLLQGSTARTKTP